MRILHVNKFLYRRGGAEGYLLDLAALQRQAGHEVELFGMQHPDNEPQRFEEHFPTEKEFEPAPPAARDRLALVGRLAWSTSAAKGMSQVLDAFKPDVVHAHNIYHQLSPSVLRPAAERNIPVVMTLHDYKLVCPTYQFLDRGELCTACVTGGPMQAVRRRCKDGSLAASGAAALEVWAHRKTGAYSPVSRFICPSQFLAEQVRLAGVFPERLTVIDNFTQTSGIAPADSAGQDLVYFGRLSHEKGVDTLINAVAKMASGNSSQPVTLHIAGDGPERASLQTLAARVAPDQVRFHGRLARTELVELVRGALVSVVPSRWYENQPLSVLESFACGVPVVGTRLGGLPDLISDGETGRLVPHDDPAALATALSELVDHPSEAHRMGQAARVLAERRFSPETHMEAVDKAYLASRREVMAI